MYTILTIIAGVYDHMIRMVLQNVYFFSTCSSFLSVIYFFPFNFNLPNLNSTLTLFSNRIKSKCDTEKEYKYCIVIKVLYIQYLTILIRSL